MGVFVQVLGPVRVTDAGGLPRAAGSRRRRELLGRLVAAGGRAVPLRLLVDDLWEDPTPAAPGAVRTFVSELRRALEPDRAPRARSRVIETVGTGYALRLPRAHVDAHRFEDALRAVRAGPDGATPDGSPPDGATPDGSPPDGAPPNDVRRPDGDVVGALERALSWWDGEPYADLPDSRWVTRERARLTELRSQATEARARALLDLGRGAPLVPDLAAFAASHPWRERAWALLAHALYQADRQVDALASLRTARAALLDRFALDAAPALDRLEADILRRAPHLTPAPRGEARLRLLARTEATGTGTRLRSASAVARAAALTGGSNLQLAQAQHAAAVEEAERTGDALLTARVIAGYDVPTVWTRADDPARAAALVATARRTLARLGPDAPPALRARLLATVALEHRGSRDRWAAEAAAEAERIARELPDAPVLALALNGRFVQSFQRPARSGERGALGAELVGLAARHDLPAFGILGHLVSIQACAARGAADAARRHVEAVERLAVAHETPLVHLFVAGFRVMREAERLPAAAPDADPAPGPAPGAEEVAAAYHDVARDLPGAGMPGLSTGLLPLALLALHLRHGRPAPTDPALDWGPHLPWARPLLHLAGGDRAAARRAAAALPEPPADHLTDALWAVTGHTALRLGARPLARRAREALAPFRGEIAGGTTALVTLGPVDDLLAALDRFLDRRPARHR